MRTRRSATRMSPPDTVRGNCGSCLRRQRLEVWSWKNVCRLEVSRSSGYGPGRVFFFQAEDGIRDYKVTGVQTCALPISSEIPHIFKRFYRVDASRGETPGSGLGLPIVEKLVVLHGGTISVQSVPGKGSRDRKSVV